MTLSGALTFYILFGGVIGLFAGFFIGIGYQKTAQSNRTQQEIENMARKAAKAVEELDESTLVEALHGLEPHIPRERRALKEV